MHSTLPADCGESIKPRRRLSLTPRFARPKRALRDDKSRPVLYRCCPFMQGNHHQLADLLFARFRCLSGTGLCVLIPLSRPGVCCLYTCCFLSRPDSICFLLFLSIHDTTLFSSVAMEHIMPLDSVCIVDSYCFWKVRASTPES
jgi:hypothetical protein